MGPFDTKILEIRDRGTCIMCMAAKFSKVTPWESWAIARTGFGGDAEAREWYVLLWPMDGGCRQATTDPFEWLDSRTLHEAHIYLRDHADWDFIKSGSVIDVEFIRGDTDSPKCSEYEETYSS
jgi:hypothetical protein